MSLIIRQLHKTAEQDHYSRGADPATATCSTVAHTFSAEDLKTLCHNVCDFLGIDSPAGSVEINSCDENGRIDFFLTETDHGECSNEQDFSRWKVGQQRLWACSYTAYVEEIKPATLHEVEL